MKYVKKEKIRKSSSHSLLKTEAPSQSQVPVNLDQILVSIHYIRLNQNTKTLYKIQVSFSEQVVLNACIRPAGPRDIVVEGTNIAFGEFFYDPSDYAKINSLANVPMIVQIQPIGSAQAGSNYNIQIDTTEGHVDCCNLDILPLFIDQEKLCIRTRMQPMVKPSPKDQKSWCSLPLITLQVSVNRHPENRVHHEVLKLANHIRVTVLAAYNLPEEHDDDKFTYTAATNMPVHNDTKIETVTFGHGYKAPVRFDVTSVYPSWESLRSIEQQLTEQDEEVADLFTVSNEKIAGAMEDIANEDEIELDKYVNVPSEYTTVWASFHRCLLLEDASQWVTDYIRDHSWPLEVHMYGSDSTGYSFMAFLSLFQLLYPGEDTMVLAVPLLHADPALMMERSNCGSLLPPNQTQLLAPPPEQSTREFSKYGAFTVVCSNLALPIFIQATKIGTAVYKLTVQSAMSAMSAASATSSATGRDGSPAFVILQVKLARPLRPAAIPPHIPDNELMQMLSELEQSSAPRECTGRGQRDRDWADTVRLGLQAIRRLPYYGMTEFCTFNRQLAETRTRVELMTSFWQDAAIFVNNNYRLKDYIYSDCQFEELLMLAHPCLLKVAVATLTEPATPALHPLLRAARHARQMQDIPHAADLYMLYAYSKKRNAGVWRELATALKDCNKDWAWVCMTKSIFIYPRSALSLLSMGGMAFESHPDEAEPFFQAILSMYPFWTTGWFAVSAYYHAMELFTLADMIEVLAKRTDKDGLTDPIGATRTWESELGDWWDPPPLLPGMSRFYDVADLLLRLRVMKLADICLARAVLESAGCPVYFHQLALSCRLRGRTEDALCHVRRGIREFGDVSYLRTLEADCLLAMNDFEGAMESYDKAGTSMHSYSLLTSLPSLESHRARPLVVDLLRRTPSAYAWLALADDWLQREDTTYSPPAQASVPAVSCAVACAVQALAVDRRAGRAWALLASLVQPRARREYCRAMAHTCGYWTEESANASEESLSYLLGKNFVCKCRQYLDPV